MKRILFGFGVAVLLAIAVCAQIGLHCNRPVRIPAMAESAFAAFGGLRSIAAEVTWFRVDRLQEEGRYVELAQLAHALTLAEPHVPEVWSYAAWNLAYNVSVMMATDEDRWRWVFAALRLLRDNGLRYNPDSVELHRELAWMFELKIGADLDSAAPTYRRKWREIVADAQTRGAWHELAMVPEEMDEIGRRLGMADRGDPQFSAAYWAIQGLRHAKQRGDRSFLLQVVRQAKTIYDRTHGSGGNG